MVFLQTKVVVLLLLIFCTVFIFQIYRWYVRIKKDNHNLMESERSKTILLENLPGMAYKCRFDKGWTMLFVSQGCKDLTGYSSEDLINNNIVSYNDIIHPDDRDRVFNVWQEAYEKGIPGQLEYRIFCADGTEKWVYERGTVYPDPAVSEKLIEGIIIDISERKAMEQKLYNVSIHDELTGLYTRNYVFERLKKLVREYERDGKTFTLTMMDLDFFKELNDTWGHQAGDMALKDFSRMILDNYRSYDLAARFGGEEFLVLGVNMSMESGVTALYRLKEKVKRTPIIFDGNKLFIKFSAGICSVEEFSFPLDIDLMVQKADRRLYIAKETGRDRIVDTDV